MSEECLSESPEYDLTVKVENLYIALARCPDCDQYPMIEIWEGGLLCPKCRKQYCEGPHHDFVRHVFQYTENVPDSLIEEKIKEAKKEGIIKAFCPFCYKYIQDCTCKFTDI